MTTVHKIALTLFGACIVAFGGFSVLNWASPLQRDLRLCDAEISSRLKSPSTYHRLETPQYYMEGTHSYVLTYEAENSFGALVQSRGLCIASPDLGSARWLDQKAT